jgi:hypothetical protein
VGSPICINKYLSAFCDCVLYFCGAAAWWNNALVFLGTFCALDARSALEDKSDWLIARKLCDSVIYGCG